MKSLLTAFLLLISAQTYAQVRTGTGPDVKIKSLTELESELSEKLTQASTFSCGAKKLIYFQDMLKFYTHIQAANEIGKIVPEPLVGCFDELGTKSPQTLCYFENQETVETLKTILGQSPDRVVQYFQDTHDITEDQARGAYKFYSDILVELTKSKKK